MNALALTRSFGQLYRSQRNHQLSRSILQAQNFTPSIGLSFPDRLPGELLRSPHRLRTHDQAYDPFQFITEDNQ